MLAGDGALFGFALLCVLLGVSVRAVMSKTFGVDGEWLNLALLHYMLIRLCQIGLWFLRQYVLQMAPRLLERLHRLRL